MQPYINKQPSSFSVFFSANFIPNPPPKKTQPPISIIYESLWGTKRTGALLLPFQHEKFQEKRVHVATGLPEYITFIYIYIYYIILIIFFLVQLLSHQNFQQQKYHPIISGLVNIVRITSPLFMTHEKAIWKGSHNPNPKPYGKPPAPPASMADFCTTFQERRIQLMRLAYSRRM